VSVILTIIAAFYGLFAFIIFNAWLFAKIINWFIMRDLSNERRKDGKDTQ